MDDHYLVLKLRRNATEDEILAAYRELVGKYHPDRHSENELIELAEEKLKAINEAYAVLSDPEKRAVYDRKLSAKGPILRMAQSEKRRPPWPLRLLIGAAAGAFLVFLVRLLQHPRAAALFLLTFGIVWFYNRRRR